MTARSILSGALIALLAATGCGDDDSGDFANFGDDNFGNNGANNGANNGFGGANNNPNNNPNNGAEPQSQKK